MPVEPDGAEQPEQRVAAEQGEGDHQQGRHDDEDIVELGEVLAVQRVRMGSVAGEAGVGLGVALAAGVDDVAGGQAGVGIGGAQHVMVAVAVVAGGHMAGTVGLAQGHGLAVVGVAVVLQAVRMALAAHHVATGLEVAASGCLDLVGRVTLDAHGAAGITLGQELAVDALVVDLLHGDVALAAGLGHVGVVDGGAAVDAALDVVHPVAVVAAGGHDEALLEQRHAVDALLVLGAHGGVHHLVLVRQVLVGVALGAGLGQVHLVDGRGVRLDGHHVVVAVAAHAGGRTRGAQGLAHAVDAGLVDLVLFRVTGGAVHGLRVHAIVGVVLDVRVAALTAHALVDRATELGLVHKQGLGLARRHVLGHGRVAVAVEAVLLDSLAAGSLGRSRGQEGTDQEQGTQQPAGTAHWTDGWTDIQDHDGSFGE